MEHLLYQKIFPCPKCGTPVVYINFCFWTGGVSFLPLCPDAKCDFRFDEPMVFTFAGLQEEARDLDLERFIKGDQKPEQPMKQIAVPPPVMTEEDIRMLKGVRIDPGDGTFT